jgi:hypothetical protein
LPFDAFVFWRTLATAAAPLEVENRLRHDNGERLGLGKLDSQEAGACPSR